MKKISDEEFSRLLPGAAEKKQDGRISRSPVYSAIYRLPVGENLFITKQEWKGYRTPKRICRYIMKNFPKVKYFFEKLKDGSGWVIKRLE